MIRIVLAAFLALLATAPLRAQIEVQEITSPGGIDAWLVEEPSIPFVALEFRFVGGTSLDAPGQEGATEVMAALMSEGAGELDSRAFATALEALAASFSISAGRDTIAVSAQMLSENRTEAAALLRTALAEPRFDVDALERVRARAISGVRSDARNPSQIAGRTFAELAWGDRAYGRPASGTEDSLAALTRDDLQATHAGAFARDRLFVSAVGDISEAELGALLDDLLGWLPATGAPLPDKAEPALDGGVTVVDFDGPQAVILFGHAGLPREDDDFIPAFVMNEVLGGGRFGTRLMRELREVRGLTYGVGTGLASGEFGDTVQGFFSTDNARAADAIEVVRTEWARMAADGVTDAELEAIQTYLTGAYPLRFEGNATIADILVGMQVQGLPADYIARRNDLVRAVTVEDVRAIADRLLDPDALRFVVVGRPAGLETTN
jgi:zinc protease